MLFIMKYRFCIAILKESSTKATYLYWISSLPTHNSSYIESKDPCIPTVYHKREHKTLDDPPRISRENSLELTDKVSLA